MNELQIGDLVTKMNELQIGDLVTKMNELQIGDLVTVEWHEQYGVMQVADIGVSGVQCETPPDSKVDYHVEVFPAWWVKPVPVPVNDQVRIGVPEAVGSIDTATGLWVPPVPGTDAGVL